MSVPAVEFKQVPKNILIILPRQLGDVLLATPIPKLLKENFPTARVSWCTHPMSRQLLDGNPYLDEVLYYPVPPKAQYLKYLKTFSLKEFFVASKNYILYLMAEVFFLFDMRRKNFDTVVDAMNNPRTVIQTLATGASLKISFTTRTVRNLFFDILVEREVLDREYLAKARLRLLEPLGIEIPDDPSVADTLIPVSQDDLNVVEDYIKDVKDLTSAPNLLILSPTHRKPVRRWPGDEFVKLGFEVIKNHGDAIVWIWGPGEMDFVKTWHDKLRAMLIADGLPKELSQIAPLFTIRQTAAFCGRARGWVGNSNGLSHMAVAGGGKTVQIHGPSRPQSWTHPDRNKHRGVRRNKGCVECGLNECQLARRECLLDLECKDVYRSVRELFYK